MHLYILLLTIFFYPSTGKPPAVIPLQAPSYEMCMKIKDSVAAKVQQSSEVAYADVRCEDILEKDKV